MSQALLVKVTNVVQFLMQKHKCLQQFCHLIVFPFQTRECVSTGAEGARALRSLGHHRLHPLILRLLVLCAPAVLRPRALQDVPAPADPNS